MQTTMSFDELWLHFCLVLMYWCENQNICSLSLVRWNKMLQSICLFSFLMSQSRVDLWHLNVNSFVVCCSNCHSENVYDVLTWLLRFQRRNEHNCNVMDLVLLLGIASALLVILLTVWLLTRKSPPAETKSKFEPYLVEVSWFTEFAHWISSVYAGAAPARRINQGEAADSSIPRRAQIARNQRRNAPPAATSQQQESEESDDNAAKSNPFADTKMGAKKRAKLEAKAEKRQQREAELEAREVNSWIQHWV